MNTPDAYDRRPLAQDARTLTREHFFSGPRAINTTVTGEMLDDIRISCHAAPDAPACPDFLYAAKERVTCAAFIEESRMECIDANRLHRKSGVRAFP
jgi:hypothetical protein